MKKIKNLPESDFLKLFYGFFSLCFLIAAFFMPDRGNILSGLWQILSSPCKVSTNYFAVGGYAATFLNMGLVGLACTGLYVLLKSTANNVSTLALILTVGFCSWGINILNMWPSILGVVLYALVKKEKPGTLVNAMLFSTGIAPLISELMLRYPHAEAIGFNVAGVILSLAVGVVIGFFLPAGLAHAPKVHKGFDLYSAAVPVGMTAFLLHTVLYKALGVAVPAAPAAETLQVASQLTVNVFCGIVFGLCVVFALLLGCKPKEYWILLKDPDQVSNFSATYGNAVMLMNVGLYGLMILGYYNLVGASFNGVTFGIIMCMLATCNSGTHPGNVWPIMLGYIAASYGFGWLSTLVGGNFTQAVNAQAILIGLCYANGLSPIADKYGWLYGFLGAILHYCMVTTVPSLHGGFCLYNGGFTAALVCLLMVPALERMLKTKEEKRALKAK
jgi:hypothetical protein